MKKLLASLMALTFSTSAFASFEEVKTLNFPALDIHKLHDKEVQREIKGEAPHFAIPNTVEAEYANAAEMIKRGDQMVWQRRIKSPNAVSLNFSFSEFNLSENAILNIYSADLKEQLRPYTVADNNIYNELWTPVVMADDVIIELVVPASEVDQTRLKLGSVNQGFRTFAQSTEKAGSCNVDVVCSEGDNWRDEINTVAVISRGGRTFCTGFMVNNANNDKTPFFMTANHCGINSSNASSLVTYWNYQASSCGGSRNGQRNQYQSGAVHLASGKKSDFTLVKLLQDPDPAWNVKYAGWDRTGVDATTAVAIHHPSTDEKSISFEFDGTSRNSYLDRGRNTRTHVKVADWDVGTTEPGSSGSPLFDQNHRVIGQLHGGYASCSSQTADWYGSFEVSWEGDGSNSASLAPHLDPDNTGVEFVDTI